MSMYLHSLLLVHASAFCLLYLVIAYESGLLVSLLFLLVCAELPVFRETFLEGQFINRLKCAKPTLGHTSGIIPFTFWHPQNSS